MHGKMEVVVFLTRDIAQRLSSSSQVYRQDGEALFHQRLDRSGLGYRSLASVVHHDESAIRRLPAGWQPQ
jgi:hypothetical protein